MDITAENKNQPLYTPGLDRWSLYKDIWIKHWKGLQEIYHERFYPIYGELSEEKITEVEKLISCGNFQNGFQRHICPKCKTQLIVPFTCKSDPQEVGNAGGTREGESRPGFAFPVIGKNFSVGL